MPELPEVETIKNDLRSKILGKKIGAIEIRKKGTVRGKAGEFTEALKGSSFTGVGRIGKLIIFGLRNGSHLLVHLKMTGQLVYQSGRKLVAGGHFTENFAQLPNAHTRLIIKFDDGSNLFFNDMRRFGYAEIADKARLEKVRSKFGIEPLTGNFIFRDFKKIFAARKIAVKGILLDQALIAGIGNIYADEILFEAGVRPDRPGRSLSETELRAIFSATERVLKKAVRYRGTSFSDYVDSAGKKGNFGRFLKVYGRAGRKCLRCGGTVKKMRLAGRGTAYCEKCQK